MAHVTPQKYLIWRHNLAPIQENKVSIIHLFTPRGKQIKNHYISFSYLTFLLIQFLQCKRYPQIKAVLSKQLAYNDSLRDVKEKKEKDLHKRSG